MDLWNIIWFRNICLILGVWWLAQQIFGWILPVVTLATLVCYVRFQKIIHDPKTRAKFLVRVKNLGLDPDHFPAIMKAS